ncbi:MAG: toll/interleukin-1 receptor domain-containing protein [Ferruginibacter sp.]
MHLQDINIDYLIQNDKDFLNRDKCWNDDYQKMYGGKLVPPINEYKELVLNILPIMLTNGTRDDINRFEVGMWEQIADGAYYRSAVYTSANISTDKRLQNVTLFGDNVYFDHDLRVYYSNERFYFKNIETRDATDVTIPQLEMLQYQDELQQIKNEITLKTKSQNIELAFSWIDNKINSKPLANRHNNLNFDVFISHKSADFEISHRLYNYLVSKGKKVFLSEISLPKLGSTEFMKKIDEAIENSKHMIAVCSNIDYLNSGWVEAEWRMFINEKRSERKDGNFFTLIVDPFTINSLPISIRQYDVFSFNQKSIENSLNYLN